MFWQVIRHFFSNQQKIQQAVLQKHFPGADVSGKKQLIIPTSLEVGERYIFNHPLGIFCAVVTIASFQGILRVEVKIDEIVFKNAGVDERYCQGKPITVLANALYLPPEK